MAGTQPQVTRPSKQFYPSYWTLFPNFLACLFFFWLIFPLLQLCWAYLRLSSTRYEVTATCLRKTTGVFNRDSVTFSLKQITFCKVRQTWTQRLLNVGDIKLEIIHHERQTTVDLKAIPNPQAICRLIDGS